MNPTELPISIPEDAHYYFFTPTRNAGKYSRSRDYRRAFQALQDALDFAASGQGNGSGKVYEEVSFYQYVEVAGYKSNVSFRLEKEHQVTEFTPEGKVQQKKFEELVNCKHLNTRTTMTGAGCYKDYDITCVDCRQLVG